MVKIDISVCLLFSPVGGLIVKSGEGKPREEHAPELDIVIERAARQVDDMADEGVGGGLRVALRISWPNLL